MNNKWIKIILAASLALNLAFVSTAVYREIPGQTGNKKNKPNRDISLDADFNFSRHQEEKIKKIIKAFRMNLLEYKRDILDKRIAIIEALGETEFNLEDIENKTGELSRLENQLNLVFVQALMQINALLEPEQRLKFLYKLSRNWFFIERRHKREAGAVPKRRSP